MAELYYFELLFRYMNTKSPIRLQPHPQNDISAFTWRQSHGLHTNDIDLYSTSCNKMVSLLENLKFDIN
jgi:hypothetical protein